MERPGNFCKPVGMQRCEALAEPERFGIPPGRRQRIGGDIDARRGRSLDLGEQAPAQSRRCRCRDRECGSRPPAPPSRARRAAWLRPAFRYPAAAPAFRRQRQPQAVELAKAEDPVHRLAADSPLDARPRSRAATSGSTSRSGVGDRVARGRAGEMLDDQPRIERRHRRSAGLARSCQCARSADAASASVVAAASAYRSPTSASSFDWWSAISAEMISSSSPIITRSSL